jgi:hypothetical protein
LEYYPYHPFSADTREKAMKKFKEEARAKGIAVPSALENIDAKTGF